MADIVDPYAVKQVREFVRPMCERLRGVEAELRSFLRRWDRDLGVLIDSGTVNEDRADQGVMNLDAADIKTLVVVFGDIRDTIATQIDTIERGCVRALKAE